MKATWDYLEYNLNTRGIPADTEEIVTDDYEPDPWRPAPNTEAVRITLTKDDAAKLAGLIIDELEAQQLARATLRRKGVSDARRERLRSSNVCR